MAGGHSHRSTLKNDHKPFKSKHSTKGQLKNQYKGKVEKTTAANKTIKPLTKLERKNLAKQLKNSKILDTKQTRRVFEGSHGAEKIVTIITLTDDVSGAEIALQLFSLPGEDKVIFETPSVTSMKVARFKSNLKVVLPDLLNFLAVLDAAKIADFVVFGISAQEEVQSDYGEQILRAVIAQGIASVIGVLPNVVSTYPKRNLQMDIRQSLQLFFHHFFPSEEKLFALELESECLNCLRTLCQKFPKSITWRDQRGWLVADAVSWQDGALCVDGIVRGAGFQANRLVHIPGFGDFQIERIERAEAVIAPDAHQELLEELNNEEVEMESLDDDDVGGFGVKMDDKHYFDDDGSRNLHQSKRLPRGTSDYQGRWYLDDVLEGASDVDDGSDEDNDRDVEVAAAADEPTTMDVDATTYEPTEGAESEMFEDLLPEEELRQLKEYRDAVRDDLEWPDELELDPHELAKERLAAYRGIKSLANCEWDYDEADQLAPSIWGRLLRIHSYKATRNKIVKQNLRQAQVHMGDRVRVLLRAPLHILDRVQCSAVPFVVYGLLEHEHKLGLVHFLFELWEDYEEPVASRELIVVQYGPRRQVIQPLFNQASNNANNVHKYERFHHPGNMLVASCIAPVLFSNAPTIFFKPAAQGALELIGQGTFLNCDHTRVVAERAVLTGHPVKIHKRVVTIRYMFFNPEDIHWFKAIPLFTKSGRSGFIKESLGTHGYYKATFDGKLSAQDTVAMSMYRRVWPEVSQSWLE